MERPYPVSLRALRMVGVAMAPIAEEHRFHTYSSNATSCTNSGGWSESEPTSGSASTGALSATTTFTLTCSGANGTTPATENTTLTVQLGGGH
jgi:hypothetical protein